MTDAPLVQINIDPPEKIAELYGIGLARAKRIVRYREKIGLFQNPEDLAQVEGIGLDLAITLSPHIDWELPVPQLTQPIKRDWFFVLLSLVLIFIFSQFLIKNVFPNLISSIQGYWNGGTQSAWTNVWADVSKSVVNLGLILLATLLMAFSLTISPDNQRKLGRIAIIIGMVELLFGTSILLARVIKYQFYDLKGWTGYFSEPSHLAPFVVFLPTCMIVVPVFLVIFWPSLRIKPQMARTYDFTIIISAPLFAFMVWAERSVFSIGYLFIIGLFGLYIGYIGLESMRTGESIFTSLTYEILDPKILHQITITKGNWQAWMFP